MLTADDNSESTRGICILSAVEESVLGDLFIIQIRSGVHTKLLLLAYMKYYG